MECFWLLLPSIKWQKLSLHQFNLEIKFASRLLESILKLGLHQRVSERIWKMLLTWRRNKSTFNTSFIVCLTIPKLTLGQCQLLPRWKGWRGTWKIYFPVKNGFPVKNLFWVILGPKMMASLNTRCNISIRTSVHLCKFVSSS